MGSNKTQVWAGQIFNSCEILEPVNVLKNTCVDKFKVKCFCGRIFECQPYRLKQGNTKSCGCFNVSSIINRNKTVKKKYNYYNYINDFGIKLVRPQNALKEGCRDNWIALCPHHNPPLEFIIYPNQITQNIVKSCGCLISKKSSENMENYHKRQRIEKGINENEFLLEKNDLIRRMIFDPIKILILKVDNYTCNLCLEKGCGNLNVHHINPINNFIIYNDKNTFNDIYNIQNLVTLCNDCHGKAHLSVSNRIDLNIKKELQAVTSMRIIPKDIQTEYDMIVNTKIKPWIESYVKEIA